MSDDLAITPVRATPPEPPAQRVAVPAATSPAPSAPLLLNPVLHLEANLGVMVMEFRDSGGSVTHTIPTQRQLDAYRFTGAPLPGMPSTTAVPAHSAGA